MIDYIDLGPVPSDEECAQVGDSGYTSQALRECRAYRNQLLRVLMSARGSDAVPPSFSLVIHRQGHDFGPYYEVAVRLDDRDERAEGLAYWLEEHLPNRWDIKAKEELSRDCSTLSIM